MPVVAQRPSRRARQSPTDAGALWGLVALLFALPTAAFAQRDSERALPIDSLETGARIRVWIGSATSKRWQAGTYVDSDAESLRFDRTDALAVQGRVVVPRDSVVRLDTYRPTARRGAMWGCGIGGGLLAIVGAGARDPDSPGIGTRLAVLGFGVGCALGGTVGLAIGSFRTWRPVAWPMSRVGAP